MRRALIAIGCVTLASGCIATLSQPRGEAHLRALRDASRHYHHGRMEEAAAAFAEAARTAERRVDRDEAQYRHARTLLRLARSAASDGQPAAAQARSAGAEVGCRHERSDQCEPSAESDGQPTAAQARSAGAAVGCRHERSDQCERESEALAILDAIARRRPISRRTIRALFDAALIRIDRGERERADEALTFIVNERPDDGPASRSLRLMMAAREGEPAAARLALLDALYERVGESDLGDDILAFEADILLESGDRAGAIRALERIVREHPYPRGQRWDDALFRLADLAEEDGEHEAAIAHLTRLVSLHEETVVPGSQTLPRMPEARLRIARIYRDRLRDTPRAAAHFTGMYEQFPTSTLRDDALYELGAMWLDTGSHTEGCAMLARVVSEFEVGHARRLAARRIERECGER